MSEEERQAFIDAVMKHVEKFINRRIAQLKRFHRYG